MSLTPTPEQRDATNSLQPPLGVKLDQYKARTDLIAWDALDSLPRDNDYFQNGGPADAITDLNNWFFDGKALGLERAMTNTLGTLQMNLTGGQPLRRANSYMQVAPAALIAVGQVLDYGARKYAPRNWESGVKYSQYFAAAQRHLLAHMTGDVLDHETNLPHLAHAACCLMFLLAFVTRNQTEWDDRPVREKKEAKP